LSRRSPECRNRDPFPVHHDKNQRNATGVPPSVGPTFHLHPPHPAPASERVPVWRKAAYGSGGLTDFLFPNIVNALAVPIYSIALKMDPLLLAIALAVPRVVGAILDPLAGAVSDNARTRWGRRRPFIVCGAVIGALLLPLIWMPPVATQSGRFIYLVSMLSMYAAAFSVFSVAYGALGIQLTTNYDERTRVMAWRGYLQTAGTFGSAWFYWFCLLPVFDNEAVGARWLGVIVGLIMLAGAVATVLACPENTGTIAKQPKIDLGAAFKFTLRNRPFLLLQSVTVILVLGLGCEGVIGSYVHIYYTCQGSKAFASYVTGIGGTLTIFSTLAALPFGLWLSTRTGKRQGALVGLLIALMGVCLMPFLLVPGQPYLIMIEWVILAFGIPCANLMFSSMTADICDEDELVTGLRREGAYVAVGGFLGKIAQVATLLLAGALPRLAGYADTSVPPALGELKVMRAMLIGIQFVAVLAAIIIIWFYPLTRSRSEATRRLLDERKQTQADG
jgi:GPH family glycoside/pentoside/hexuronide:cation symporter